MLGSTSDLCRERAEAGEADGLAVLARRQTAGRGRYGRGWQAPAGNLNLSVLLRPGQGVAEAPAMALVFGLAVYRAIRQVIGNGEALSLKWPNDVLLDGGKVAGVLVEGSVSDSPFLVVGFGVNLLDAPILPERRTSCLADVIERPPGAEAFALRLLQTLATALETLAGEGLASLRQDWLEAAHAVGSTLYVTLADGVSVEGRFAGLAADGALLLDRDGVVEAIRSGDVLLA